MSITREKLNEIILLNREREEKELYAAWRAGYDYVFKVQSHNGVDRTYIPSNRPKRFRSNYEYRVTRYDLGDVDDDVVMEAYNE